MTLSEAIEAVGLLVRRFPNGGANAGKDYIGGLAAVLMEYPRSISLRCHDPVRGVPRETEYLPTPSVVIAWCERETTELRRPVDREDRDGQMREQFTQLVQDEKFWAADRAARPSYDDLKAKHGENWGIQQRDETRNRDFAKAEIAAATTTLRQRENIAAGLDPDAPVSAALLKAMREKGYVGKSEAAE
jgi:hypothetical protein